MFSIGADHPSLPGHFPGHPIVPGVVLLDAVLVRLPDGARLRNAKFLHPVRPEETVELETVIDAKQATFTARCGGRIVLRGAADLP